MTPGLFESGLRELVAELVREELDRQRAEEAAAAPAANENLTVREAAAYCKLARITLDQMRARGEGPPYQRAGRRVLYRRADVDAWLKGPGR